MIGYCFVRHLSSLGHWVDYTYLFHPLTLPAITGVPLDVTDKESVRLAIQRLHPDVVIHTAALTDMDRCETDHLLADRVNREGTRNIVQACQAVHCSIVYLSTPAVFTGGVSACSETDSPHPVNYYGLTKLEGERIVLASGLPVLILRTDQPYCWLENWQRQNSVTRVLGKLTAGETVKEVSDWYNHPTFVDDFVRAATELLVTEKNGIYHLAGPDFINRYDLAITIAEVFGKDRRSIIPMSSSALNLPAKRPHVRLNVEKAYRDLGRSTLTVTEGLTMMRSSVVPL
ncbi:MAG: SDR family oxidoreductase [Acidobacteria bacterium]|nr:SDR family oxidoreductase [Acidobacteriota bacterium]